MGDNKKQTTIYDISKLAGVSIATVSRVLNGSSKVSPDTRDRVLRIISESNYEPNVFARGLGLGSMKTIGILCADVSDIYLAASVSFLERELRKNNFDTVLHCTGYNYEQQVKSIRAMEARKVAAVIMVGSHYIESSNKKNEYIRETARRIPVMLQNGYLDDDNIYGVLSEDENAFYDATSLLLSSGRKRIMFLYRERTYSETHKYNGFVRALNDSGVSIENALFVRSRNTIRYVKDDIKPFFEDSSAQPDAILACDDELAIGALKCLQELKIQIPEQVSLIGCNNSVLSISCEPELTTIDNMCEILCIDIVNALMQILDGQKAPGKTMVSCKLVERGTTDFRKP